MNTSELKGAVTAQVKLEHNLGWAVKNPQHAYNSVSVFLAEYAGNYNITVDTSRDGYITYIADIKWGNKLVS
tara:strand:- start:21230 stop:21445 length:216 start_codon:yes stop_codon:yes gene_type:complete